MKKIVRLTESQLNRLIEQALNELDWRTYQSAANKRAEQYQNAGQQGDWDTAEKYRNSRYNLQQGAQKTFNQKYAPNANDSKYSFYNDSNWQDGKQTPTWAAQSYNKNTGIERTIKNGQSTEEMTGFQNDYATPTNGNMSMGDAEIADFQSGKSNYTKGKGWSNESRARKVTESIIRKLRRV